MITRLILQINKFDEENLVFLTDPTATVDECLITSDRWQGSKVIVETIELIGSQTALYNLIDKEFHYVGGGEAGETVEVPVEEQLDLLNRAQQHYQRSLETPIVGP